MLVCFISDVYNVLECPDKKVLFALNFAVLLKKINVMKRAITKVFQPIVVLIIMFLTLNSFTVDEKWEDIFLRGTWEEIDRSATGEQQTVSAGYANGQVKVSTYSRHSAMTVRLFADGVLVSEVSMPASDREIILPVPVSAGKDYGIEITSELGGFLSGCFVAD